MAITARAKSLPLIRDGVTAAAAARTRQVALAAVAALLLALSLGAAPAGAVVTEAGGTKVGLQPRSETLQEGKPTSPFANENGNVVVHASKVFAIYWDPQNKFHHEWLANIDTFLQRMGASSGQLDATFADLGQYRDRSNTGASYNTVFKGSYSDTAKYPASGCTDPNPGFTREPLVCLTDAQLREQLQSFIASHSLPTGMNSIFYLLTPPGVSVCIDAAATRCSDYQVSLPEEEKEERNSTSWRESFCSYHSAISPTSPVSGDENTILYAAIPWSAGTAGAGTKLAPAQRVYTEAFDCQDGGFNPEGHKETEEHRKELTKAEEETFAKASGEEKARLEKQRLLEGRHQEEPNQEGGEEGKGELGDYAAGLADLIDNQIAEEQSNILTNPLLNAWQDSEGREVTDECRNHFASTVGLGSSRGTISGEVTAGEHTEAGTLSNMELSSPELGSGRYYINNVFSLSGSAGRCVGGAAMVPRFTAPNPVNSNELVGFDGMESTVGLLEGQGFGPSGPPIKTYATFSWNFGDGSPEVKGFAPGAPLCEAPWLSPCAASTFHAYTYGGTYQITLTITDVAGNTDTVTHLLTVVGPPPPSPGSGNAGSGSQTGPGSSGSSGGSSGSGGSGGSGGGHTSISVHAPTVAAAVSSHSLRTTLRKGLRVRYAVNERVTGHFEVLLAKSVAGRLGLHGPLATGLAPGTPPQIVIGRAILVTNSGGQNTVTIQFSKTVAQRLRRLHGVTLMVRVIARNAFTRSATVLTTVTLTH